MSNPNKTILITAACAALVIGGWFGTADSRARHAKELADVAESRRQPTGAEWDGYLKKAEDAMRQEVAVHKGEQSAGGLRIGMSRSKALAALPGGVKDRTYPDVMRFPAPSQKGQEVIARFIDDQLCFSTVAATGTDAFGIDMVKRYGEPKDYNGGSR